MVRLMCVECGAPDLDGAASLTCVRCGTSFPRHSHKNIPVLIGKSSTLDRAQILDMPVAPSTGREDHARQHWLTGKLPEYLRACRGKQLLVYASGDGSDRQWLESAGYEVTTFDVFPGDFTDYVDKRSARGDFPGTHCPSPTSNSRSSRHWPSSSTCVIRSWLLPRSFAC